MTGAHTLHDLFSVQKWLKQAICLMIAKFCQGSKIHQLLCKLLSLQPIHCHVLYKSASHAVQTTFVRQLQISFFFEM